jgi:hypothetical protein
MIDVVDIKVLCREGKFKAFVEGGRIYLRDTENGDTVTIGEHAAPQAQPKEPVVEVPQELIEKLREGLEAALFKAGEVGQSDIEGSHRLADNALCEALCQMGFSEQIAMYESFDKWYG